jgi:hypothetical protein
MKKICYYLTLASFLVLSACSTRLYYNPEIQDWQQQPLPAEEPLHTLYLLGDAGSPNLETTEPIFRVLKSQLDQDPKSTLVVLGDNIYHDGLPPEGHHDREKSEQKLVEQLKLVQNHQGKVVFIPGNHDWNYMGPGGLERVQLQEQFVENYLKKGNTFVPDGGCPGPVEVELSPEVVLLVIDSQWWFHEYEKPYGRFSGCAAANEAEMLRLLEQMLERNKHRHVVVAAHHPLMTNSNHGGYYSVLDHLFPLTLIRDNLFVPLPVIGSMYPFYRQLGGVDQDIPHPRYQLLIDELMRKFRNYDNIIYAAGHDHNIQLQRTEKLFHILSGSGCKTSHIVGGHNVEFIQREKGFARVMYYPNSETWVEYWTANADGSEGILSYRTRLYIRRSETDFCDPAETEALPETVNAAPAEGSPDASRGFGNILYGNQYKQEWRSPVKLPVVDLQDTVGGLTPYTTAGSEYHQTLRLRNPRQQEFLFRSMGRSVLKVVPEEYRESKTLQGQTRNQVVLHHPYAPLMVSSLEEAAGVPYNETKLVVLPESSCLGPWEESFAGTIGFLQQNAADRHWEKPENLVKPGESLEYESLIDALERNPDHKISEPLFAKLRLLDMLVGDWDRHERQYHWIAVNRNNGVTYLPVADDRDNAFFSFEGGLPWLLSRRWAIRSLQHFGHRITDLKGLNNAARSMDRRFLTSLSREEWRKQAQELQTSLSDSKLEEAVKQMPPEVFPLHGPELISKLKSRREQLVTLADRYYGILALYVDIYGTDGPELFEIIGLPGRSTQIRVFTLDSLGNKTGQRYERTFSPRETKEIRLYGLEGNDIFSTSGEKNEGILIRIVGGKGLDKSGDATLLTNRRGRIRVTDESENPSILDHTAQTSLEYASGEIITTPRSDRFFYNYIGPQAGFRYNQDDGFMPGLGLVYRTYKYRSYPFGSEHRLHYRYAFGTNSGRLSYTGTYKNALGKYDLVIDGWGYTPYFVMNYYGMGNESRPAADQEASYYQARLHQSFVSAMVSKSFATFFSVGAGPTFQLFKLSKWPGTYAADQALEQDPEPFSSKKYLGVQAYIETNIRDNYFNPTRGLLLRAEANLNQQLSRSEKHWGQYRYQVGYYMSPYLPYQLTFAGRLGGTINKGNYDFYQASMLGGGTQANLDQTLRGFPKTRFIGQNSLYTNLELRLSLLNYRLYLLPAKTGILAFFDTGRVWAPGEDSSMWHKGYGGGFWVSVINRITVSATVARSKEGTFLNIQNGFFF